MGRRKIPSKVRLKALKLRRDKRLSIDEISEIIGVSKSTLSVWLRQHPLINEELVIRRVKAAQIRRNNKLLTESKFHKVSGVLSKERKGKIAEAAVLFRLALNGFDIFSSVFDGDRIDFIAEDPITFRLIRIEVRWARQGRHGKPYIGLRKHKGRNSTKHIGNTQVNYVVGYDLFTDTAFVFNRHEFTSVKNALSMKQSAAERWDKLRG